MTGPIDSASRRSPLVDLLLMISDGDPTAWDEILRRYGKLVSTTVRSFRLKEVDAVHAVQMTWIRLAENAERVQFPERLGGWLVTTARRECLSILRQVKLGPNLTDAAPETVADPLVPSEQRIIDDETWRTFQTLLTDNPRSYAEVALDAGIPIGTIGPTRARALRQLRRILDEQELRHGAGAAEVVEREPTEGDRTGSYFLDDLLDNAEQALREKLEPAVTDLTTASSQGAADAQLDELLHRADAALRVALRNHGTTVSGLLAVKSSDHDDRVVLLPADRWQKETRNALATASAETWETAPAEDRAPVTVYVIAEPHAPLSVRRGGSPASGVNFIDNDRVVIGDDNKVRLSSEYRIAKVEVDTEQMMESLSPRAQKALRNLIANPSDAAANEEFRRALRPPEGPAVPSARDLQHKSVVSAPVEITTIDCDVVAIDDKQTHNVTIKHRVAQASLDIAGIMKDSAELASAFARQLSPTERGHGRDKLDRALMKEVTPEHLWSVVSTVPGRSPRIVAGPDSVTAVDAPLSIVGENAGIPHKTPDVGVRTCDSTLSPDQH